MMFLKAIWRRFLYIISTKTSFFSKGQLSEDIYAMAHIPKLSGQYTPWTNSAMTPSAINIILNEIVLNSRKCVVELGSGISTIYIAKVLKQIGGGVLYSIEHDTKWSKIVFDMLVKEGLDKHVKFIVAPLKANSHSLENCDWYAEEIVTNSLNNVSIDMLIVDGPSPKVIDLSRYPAIPVLKDKLSKDFCIVLDDIGRSGENKIALLWEKELNIKFMIYKYNEIALAKSNIGFNTK